MSIPEIIKDCSLEEINGLWYLFLPDYQIDNYAEFKTVMLNAMGKYKTHQKRSAFVWDEDPTDILEILKEGKDLNLKKSTQFFPTPDELVNHIIDSIGGVRGGQRILEPSAGDGAFIRGLQRYHKQDVWDVLEDCHIHVCENWELNKKKLAKIPFITHKCDDFMDLPLTEKYDTILANPPFTKNQAEKHVLKMLKHLDHQGVIACVLPASAKTNEKLIKAFDDFFGKSMYSLNDIPAGTFKASGTNVSTVWLEGTNLLNPIVDVVNNFDKLASLAYKDGVSKEDLPNVGDEIDFSKPVEKPKPEPIKGKAKNGIILTEAELEEGVSYEKIEEIIKENKLKGKILTVDNQELKLMDSSKGFFLIDNNMQTVLEKGKPKVISRPEALIAKARYIMKFGNLEDVEAKKRDRFEKAKKLVADLDKLVSYHKSFKANDDSLTSQIVGSIIGGGLDHYYPNEYKKKEDKARLENLRQASAEFFAKHPKIEADLEQMKKYLADGDIEQVLSWFGESNHSPIVHEGDGFVVRQLASVEYSDEEGMKKIAENFSGEILQKEGLEGVYARLELAAEKIKNGTV